MERLAVESLTNRQKEIVLMAAEGLQSNQIAQAFKLSRRTVDYHLGNAYSKLNLAGRMQACILSCVFSGDYSSKSKEAVDDIKMTNQQSKIFKLLCEGLTNQQIAEKLGRSSSTVSTHVTNILKKLKVSNRVAACHRARKMGLI